MGWKLLILGVVAKHVVEPRTNVALVLVIEKHAHESHAALPQLVDSRDELVEQILLVVAHFCILLGGDKPLVGCTAEAGHNMRICLDGLSHLLLEEALHFALHPLDVVVQTDEILGTTTTDNGVRVLLACDWHKAPFLIALFELADSHALTLVFRLWGRYPLILRPRDLSPARACNHSEWIRTNCVRTLGTVFGYGVLWGLALARRAVTKACIDI